ncbi:Gfo/Idh/MocA family oxidoreductase [Halalkalicoccus tibetensis]|uniref:Gfo/Idh/MocA family oxidoreductase n=1 Tax=Halalkalicoccus tibetensis TaxID=175632 RepID=A0ABD5V4K9_9EURY
MTLDVAVIGTGPEPERAGGVGYAMGYRHASAYRAIDGCELVACVDIERANAEAFAEHYDIDDRRVYEDHESMLAGAEPDLVSVCTPVTTHADIVADCAAAGVEAIHCEKPMAHTWADCKRMVETCEEAGVRLTINHQRRFAGPFRQAKLLLDDGAIGELERVKIGGKNLYDFGTHMFDMCHYVTDGASPEWVRSLLVYDEENVRYGVHNENRAMAEWEYENGVEGFAETGSADRDCLMRLEGDEGTIEIGHSNGASLRTKAADESEWTRIDTGGERVSHVAVDPGLPVKVLRKLDDATPGPQVFRPLADRVFMADEDPFLKPYVRRALQEVVDATIEDRESPLAAGNALESTELIFGCWESARQQERVELSLEIEDNPLTAMVDNGRFRPN